MKISNLSAQAIKIFSSLHRASLVNHNEAINKSLFYLELTAFLAHRMRDKEMHFAVVQFDSSRGICLHDNIYLHDECGQLTSSR